MQGELESFGHLSLAGGLGLLVGWERHIRGRPAGERTFALLTIGAAAFTVAGIAFPSETGRIIAGVATGVGFIGAGLIWHEQPQEVHGLTTAAAAWAMVAVGVLAGAGSLILAALTAALLVVLLELPYAPGVRRLDPRRYAERFRSDEDIPEVSDKGPPRPGNGASPDRP